MKLTELQERRLDRAVGAVIGSACGDALGAPIEFQSARRADKSDWITEMVGGGAFGWKPGETTDDTAMMRCVLEMYLENKGRYDQATLVKKFLAWAASGPPDIGSWTRHALNLWREHGIPGTALGEEPMKVAGHCYRPRYREHNPVFKAWLNEPRKTASNGGVMRCIPTALVHSPSTQKLLLDAEAICEDTHPDPRCTASCKAVVWMASRLIQDTTNAKAGEMRGHKRGTYSMREVWVEIMEALLELGSVELYQGLRSAATLPWAAWTNGGSSIETTVSAFAALLQARSFKEGLLAAVNRGNDADTVGAVAGGLLGARFGYAAIPKAWLRQLHGHQELRAMAIDLWLMRRC